jgi:hypothetical protein
VVQTHLGGDAGDDGGLVDQAVETAAGRDSRTTLHRVVQERAQMGVTWLGPPCRVQPLTMRTPRSPKVAY